jgi:hypothetical protein
MKRYRWFRAEWPISMRALAKRLKSKPFIADESEGFVIDRVRDDFLQARFVERMEYDDTVTDPFGKELSFHRVEFRQCEFRASTDSPGLELVDAPRSVQALVSRLAEASEFSLAISPLSVDVLAWATSVQKLLNLQGVVESLQIGSLELGPGITAKAVIRGSTDVLESGAALIKGRRHAMEKVQLKFPGSKRTNLLLTSVGALKVEAERPDEIVSTVRQSLAALLSKRP